MSGRTVYRENRAELDQDSYRMGVLRGLEAGSNAAYEYFAYGLFEASYNDHFVPYLGAKAYRTTPAEDLAYHVGYSDAFDAGFKGTLKLIEELFASAGLCRPKWEESD